MSEKHSNIQDTIYQILQRSHQQNGHKNAYNILVSNNSQSILVIPRTTNTDDFHDNVEAAQNIAQNIGGTTQVEIYRGKSPKAALISRYDIPLEDADKKEPDSNNTQIEQAVENAIQKHQAGNNFNNMGNLESINMLFGVLSGTGSDKKNTGNAMSGLAGLLGAVNNTRHENTLIQFEKKLNDYKLETQLSTLQKDQKALNTERDLLKQQNTELEKENSNFKKTVSDLENRLAGYSSTEVFKRVATGVLSGIGSRLLAGSPKVAELLGLTKDELQSALGIVDEEVVSEQNIDQDSNVEVEEVPQSQTEQQQQMFKAINDTANALKQGDVKFAYCMITIIGNCMDNKELTNSMILHLEKEKQRVNLNEDLENSTEKE